MKFLLTRPYGYAHLRKLEKEGNVAGLIEALRAPRVESSAKLRFAVVTNLGRSGAVEAVPVVSQLMLSDPEETVRCAAAKALGQCGDGAALPALRTALDDQSERVQLWAIRSLGQLHDRESVERLIDRLDNPDWGFRAYAAGALGEIGDQRAIPALVPMLEDSSSTVRTAVEQALDKLRLR